MLAIVHLAMDPEVYKAIKLDEIQCLRDVVNNDSNCLLKVTPQKNTALHIAVRFGRCLNFVREVYGLLTHNMSLEDNTEYSRSLSLLKHVNSPGDTVLHLAIRGGHTPIANFLIGKIMRWDCGSSDHDLEAEHTSLALETIRMRNKNKNTALHEAVRRNDGRMVEALIIADPDLWHPNYDADRGDGESPLYLAARDGRLDVINKILHACQSAAHGGPAGQTALHVAVIEKKQDVVTALIEKKGELVHSVDENGKTALHYATASKECEQIARCLLSHDTSAVYQLDKEGLSPLHVAALNSSSGVFQKLIQECPDSLELLDDMKHRNVLHFTVMSGDLDKIQYITEQPEYKQLINQADDDGNTPLHIAAEQGSIKVIKHFVSGGREVALDLKARNKNGQTSAEICLNRIPAVSPPILITCWMGFEFRRLASRLFYLQKSNGNGREEEQRIRSRGPNKEQIINDQDQKAKEAIAGRKKMMENFQIIASLIATMTFLPVFQVPGGYNSSDGKPILLNNKSFQSFLVCDALAMCTSIASLFTFVIASVTGDTFYTFQSFYMGTFLLFLSLTFTSLAFLEGFRAVLPHCSKYLCFSDQSTETSSTIELCVIVIMLCFPIVWTLVYAVPRILTKMGNNRS